MPRVGAENGGRYRMSERFNVQPSPTTVSVTGEVDGVAILFEKLVRRLAVFRPGSGGTLRGRFHEMPSVRTGRRVHRRRGDFASSRASEGSPPLAATGTLDGVTFEIRRDYRLGAYFFRCRYCRAEGLPHYTIHSAQLDRALHKCTAVRARRRRHAALDVALFALRRARKVKTLR